MRFIGWLIRCLAFLFVVAFAAWASLAIWYTVPAADWARFALIAGLCVLGLGGLVLAIFMGRKLALAPWAFGMVAVFAWWSMLEPRNDREWEADVARLPTVEIDGETVTLRNVRDFVYRDEMDYDQRWDERTFDLRRLDSLDLIAVYWMGDAIAHTFVSFGFGGEQIAISIEIRKEKGEAFSAIAGFFRQFELTYIVADESDLIGLRTTYRNPPEDVYLYRVNAPRARIRQLFIQYAKKINKLKEQPSFYNSATTNCTTNIVTHVRAFTAQMPLSWKILVSGYFPELIYERGSLDQELPFAELRARSLINERARDADGSADFSRLIREGLPGMAQP